MSVPYMSKAIVTASAPPYQVFVSLIGAMGGQGPTLPVQVLTPGPRDAVTGTFGPLPTVGTHGIVIFPSGDHRNGMWLGAFDPALPTAAAHAPGSSAMEYAAHYGGGWSRRSQTGVVEEILPDGSRIALGTPGVAPGRYTVDAGGNRQLTPFTASQRVPSPPAAFPLTVNHVTGASVVISASGSVNATAASGQAVTLTANGATAVLTALGAISLTAAAGHANTFTANSSTITQDASGGVTITAASGQPVTINATGGTSVTIDSAGNLSVNTAASVTLTALIVNLHAPTIFAGNGGTVQPVQLADNSLSTVFRAQ
jgi:hypothetical protein